jgi:hypothetical protein
MVISMVKPKWILQLCWKCFLIVHFHMTLECSDTKLWPVSLAASQCLYPSGQSQQTTIVYSVNQVDSTT